jgi:hypothetical protein
MIGSNPKNFNSFQKSLYLKTDYRTSVQMQLKSLNIFGCGTV